MPAFQDLTGQRFGRLVIIERGPIDRATYWNCQCDCGNVKLVRAGNLRSGAIKSCGCLQREFALSTALDITGQKHGYLTAIERSGTDKRKAIWTFQCDCGRKVDLPGTRVTCGAQKSCGCLKSDPEMNPNRSHGMRWSLAYKRWESIKQRCGNPNNPSYRNYGGRGITVCPEWRDSFEAFHAAVGDCPGQGLSLDRIDNDGNYEPGNVRWATAAMQMNNRQPYKRVSRADVEALAAHIAELEAALAAVDPNHPLLAD